MNVLLSIKPEYVSKIFAGSKQFEYRKAIFKNPNVKKVIVYSTMPEGRIVGEFDVGEILHDSPSSLWLRTWRKGGVAKDFFEQYFAGRNFGYAISVESARRYDVPVDPAEVFENFVPPQSFLYLCEDRAERLRLAAA